MGSSLSFPPRKPHKVFVPLYNTRAQDDSETNVIILLIEDSWEISREDGRIGTARMRWAGDFSEYTFKKNLHFRIILVFYKLEN